jgi:hypothetical protein
MVRELKAKNHNERHNSCCISAIKHTKGGGQMASNFKLFMHEAGDSLHLKLYGDFDGSSAHELINALKKYGTKFYQIFIDTDDLEMIHSFGRDVFQKYYGFLDKRLQNLVFIGKNKLKLTL